jgi:hypothetical protein
MALSDTLLLHNNALAVKEGNEGGGGGLGGLLCFLLEMRGARGRQGWVYKATYIRN